MEGKGRLVVAGGGGGGEWPPLGMGFDGEL